MLETTLLIHASVGVVCLVSGTAALLVAKRPGRHPLAGRIFMGALVLAYLAILPNMIHKTNLFLIGLGYLAVFSGVEGWRVLLRRNGRIPMAPTPFDYGAVGLTVLLSITLIGLGAKVVIDGNPMALVLLAFGLLGIGLVREARKRWKTTPTQPELLRTHIQLMCGAFSAALTAFVVLQLESIAGGMQWILWIAPSIFMAQVGKRAVQRYAPKTTANG